MRDATVLPSAEQQFNALPEGVQRVLDSQTFERAPALRSLLAYLWQNRDFPVSEYAVATEALGRSRSFDARTDATVRVQISRLRQRLDRYYEKEIIGASSRLSIPLGTHQVVLEYLEPISESRTLSIASVPSRQPGGSRNVFAICSLVLLLLCLTEGAFLYRARTAKDKPAPEAMSWFWQGFFANNRPTRMALPTPIFFSFRKRGSAPGATVMFRDTGINDFGNGKQSEPFGMLTKALGPAALAENYTVTSDTFAAVQLVRYLDQFGRQTSVTSNSDAPLEALDRENMIAIGTWGTLTPLRPYLDRLSFELGPHEEYVEFRHPAPGEPKRLVTVQESPDRSILPGVIALVPGTGGQTHLLVLASRSTSALVSLLTSSHGLAQLGDMWRAKGSPPYFEVAVNAEQSGRGLVRVWPVALHPYKNRP
jgi:hypothetical protein